MILNTGMRTDIPAFFSDWFFKRIKEGYVYVRNPYFPNKVTKYLLNPNVIDCLVFTTKNPKPMLSRLNELKSFGQYWFVTITPYGKETESNVPDKKEIIESFKELSKAIGKEKVGWRYDPIFISEKYSLSYHIETFEKMASELSGYTAECVISFIDLYEKTKRNFPQVQEVSEEERNIIGKEFSRIGKKYGMAIRTCVEGTSLSKYGVDCSGCMTKPVIEKAINKSLKVPKKKATRDGCDCLLGNDIGVYNTCNHGCVYCYANYNKKSVLDNIRKHNPNSPFLIGKSMKEDIVVEAKQESYIVEELKLF